MNNINIKKYNVFCGALDEIDLESSTDTVVINTINSHSYVEAKKDVEFFNALTNSSLLIPDGEGIIFASLFLKKKVIKKISGYDMFEFLMRKYQTDKIFFLGSSDFVLKKIKLKAVKEYPNIKIEIFSPPFRDKFTLEDNKIMIEKVNNFSPKVLFVGMTAPKQEKWVYENHSKLNAKIVCSIGAVFDFYSEEKKRPNKFWIKLKLEWFIRFINEPKRLWKRNLISTPLFLIDILFSKK
jgi:N-acetylglucosaminyldiphosphoundecaprenol N-acetyl-beta-D-mannosaminyltransferase